MYIVQLCTVRFSLGRNSSKCRLKCWSHEMQNLFMEPGVSHLAVHVEAWLGYPHHFCVWSYRDEIFLVHSHKAMQKSRPFCIWGDWSESTNPRLISLVFDSYGIKIPSFWPMSMAFTRLEMSCCATPNDRQIRLSFTEIFTQQCLQTCIFEILSLLPVRWSWNLESPFWSFESIHATFFN